MTDHSRIPNLARFRQPQFVFLFCLLVWIGTSCNEDENNEPACTEVQVSQLLPNSNPVGGPVLIQGSGFTDKSVVKFGDQTAEIETRTGSSITTKVPDGLFGLVEVSISNGTECIDTRDFNVSAGFPNDAGVSPPSIIVPDEGLSFPLQVGDDNIINLQNAFDEDHQLSYGLFRTLMDPIEFGTEQFKGIETPFGGRQDLIVNEVLLILNRTDSPFPRDTLEGGYYTLTLDIEEKTVTDNFLLTTSRITGRQYLFKRIDE